MDVLASALDSLARTPAALRTLLAGLDDRAVRANEGQGTYSPHDVVGHLVHGEETDWVPRIRHLLEHGDARPFEPFDRDGMRAAYSGKGIDELLDLLERRRTESLDRVRRLELVAEDLERRGLHPDLGPVTLGQLIETWVVHDLAHLAQVARVLAHDRAEAIGPWRAYFRLLGGSG